MGNRLERRRSDPLAGSEIMVEINALSDTIYKTPIFKLTQRMFIYSSYLSNSL
jgi:hypothetical protein